MSHNVRKCAPSKDSDKPEQSDQKILLGVFG